MRNHYVTLTTEKPALSVTALRGEEPPRIVGGYGGWEQVDRPGRASLVQWVGVGAYQLELPLLFDGWSNMSSVDDDCETLERMARPPDAGVEPPTIRITGAVPHRGIGWVVDTDGLDWGDSDYHQDGYRLRQFVVVTLLQRVLEDRVSELPAAEQIRREQSLVTTAGGFGGAARVYTVKIGDTLPKIAAAMYGDYKRWRDIGKANSLRDPNALTVGQEIRLP